MRTEQVHINRLTCRFENKNLEKEYLKHSWERSWKNIKLFLSVNVPVSLIIIADDIFVQGVGTNIYYLSDTIIPFGRPGIYVVNEMFSSFSLYPWSKKNNKNDDDNNVV